MLSNIELQSTSHGEPHYDGPVDSTDAKTGAVVDKSEVPAYNDGDKYSIHEGITRDYIAGEHKIVETAEDIVNQVLTVEDDPTLNPWTFRMLFLYVQKHCLISLPC
jgi:hypothetical protein